MNLRNIITTAFLLILSVSDAYAQDSAVKKLANNVYSVNLLHYTSLVVIGDDDVLITDTANSYRANLLKNEVKKLTNKPITKIVLSHEHFDHTGGTEVFPQADIYAQQNIQALLELDPLNLLPDHIEYIFDKKMVIDMGTTKVELIHIGAADGVAATIVYLPQENIALTADMYIDHGLSSGIYLTDTNLLGVRKILNMLIKMDLKHAINVHSASTSLVPLKSMADFLNDLYDEVMSILASTLKKQPSQLVSQALAISNTLKIPKYKHWPNYQELNSYIRKWPFLLFTEVNDEAICF